MRKNEMAKCFDTLAKLCTLFAEDCRSATEITDEVDEKTEVAENEITFDEISNLAKKKAADGKSCGVKEIITKFKAKKLSDISESDYEVIFKELEAL